MTEWDPVQRDEFAKALAAWEKLAPERFYLYEYFCFPQLGQNNIFPGWAPHRIAEDLKHLKSIGLRGAYNDIACERVSGSQTKDGIWVPYAWANPALDMVNFYVWLKQLDDQSRSVDELLGEM